MARQLPPARFTVRLDGEQRRQLADFMTQDNVTSAAAATRILMAAGYAKVTQLEDDVRVACIEEGMREGRAIIRKKMQIAVSQALGELRDRQSED